MKWAIYAMVYLGSALMVYNIYGYTRFARENKSGEARGKSTAILYVPIGLLVVFLLGYLAVGLFGNPDLVVSGILFGGSIFVFIMLRFLHRIAELIDDEKRFEAKLMAAEESNKARSRFLASVSHEMRTPMNAIIGLDTIILKDDTLTPQTRKRAEDIGASARHLLDLINDVLDVNALESGGLVIDREPFSMSETLDLINLLVRDECDRKGLEYRHEVIGTVDETFVGNAARLRKVLLAILDNAVKFTGAPGTVTFRTEQGEAPDGRCLLKFTIRDTGIGMDADFIPRLFESFSREDNSSTDRYGGNGLGLTVVKQLLDRMGGTIAVESRKGEGSTFVVAVPMDRAEKPADAGEDGAEVDLRGRRVLIVEDMDINAELLADLLDLEEISSERAENGQRAVECFSAHPANYFDAIFMDLRMPVMDGLEATRAIRALDRPDARTVPIIALTANAFQSDVEQTMEAGMNAHLSKPADLDLLCRTLREQIMAGSRTRVKQ